MTNKFEKLKDKIFKRIQNMSGNVILRREMNSFGSPSQISRCIEALIEAKELVKIGHGIYAKSYISKYVDRPIIKAGADAAWLEALTKLGVQWELGSAAQAYNAGLPTKIKRQDCHFCGGKLHLADYPRSPLGIAPVFRDGYESRLSFCCGTCRKRATPPSVRFFGRRWFPAPLLVFISALMHGLNQRRCEQLKRHFGITVSESTLVLRIKLNTMLSTRFSLEELVNRRSGIEGIIGDLKRRWQMGRSRMKSDRTTESSGYCAMLGFNLSQLMRNLNGEVVKKAA